MFTSPRQARAAAIAALLVSLLTGSFIARLASSEAGATTTCPSGTSVTLQNSPCVIQGYKDGPITLSASSSFQRIATLSLPAGKFALSGTLHVTLTDHRIRVVRPGAGAESKGQRAEGKEPGARGQMTQ